MTPQEYERDLIETIERLRQRNKKLEVSLAIVERSYNSIRYENLKLLEDLTRRHRVLTDWDKRIKDILKQVEKIKSEKP